MADAPSAVRREAPGVGTIVLTTSKEHCGSSPFPVDLACGTAASPEQLRSVPPELLPRDVDAYARAVQDLHPAVNVAAQMGTAPRAARRGRLLRWADGWELSTAAKGHPHPRHSGSFARLLGRCVGDEALLGLGGAVHTMTALPAQRIGHARTPGRCGLGRRQGPGGGVTGRCS